MLSFDCRKKSPYQKEMLINFWIFKYPLYAYLDSQLNNISLCPKFATTVSGLYKLNHPLSWIYFAFEYFLNPLLLPKKTLLCRSDIEPVNMKLDNSCPSSIPILDPLHLIIFTLYVFLSYSLYCILSKVNKD